MIGEDEEKREKRGARGNRKRKEQYICVCVYVCVKEENDIERKKRMEKRSFTTLHTSPGIHFNVKVAGEGGYISRAIGRFGHLAKGTRKKNIDEKGRN